MSLNISEAQDKMMSIEWIKKKIMAACFSVMTKL